MKNGQGSSSRRSKKNEIDFSQLLQGKVPPHSKDVEAAILGAVMLNAQAFDTVNEILVPEAFYLEKHQVVFMAMQRLSTKSLPIDLLTVVQELKSTGELDSVISAFEVAQLTNDVSGVIKLEGYCKLILQSFFRRELFKVSVEASVEAFNEDQDVFDLIDKVDGKVVGITAKHLRGSHKDNLQLAVESIQRVDRLRTNPKALTGTTTGYRSLNKITNGWQPGDLIILAARPSVGKTAFALNLGYNAAIPQADKEVKQTPVGFFSLEMSAGQLMNRIVSRDADIHLEKIMNGRLTDDEYKRFVDASNRCAQLPILIDDTPALSITEFRSRSRRMVNKHGVGLIIIDYLQLMSGRTDSSPQQREQEISNISRNLKAMAKELNIPIIALSQMTRSVEKEKRDPQLSDLRESGAIEQDADMVAFLTRLSYQKKDDEIDPSIRNDAKMWIKKHRNGKLENIVFKTMLETQRWFDLDEFERYSGNTWIPVPPQDDNEDLPF